MLERTAGEFEVTAEDEALQQAFKGLLVPGHYSYGAMSRVGRDFLRRHRAICWGCLRRTTRPDADRERSAPVARFDLLGCRPMPELELYRQMARIREVEERISALYAEWEMRCPVHLCIGQEAVPVGVCAALAEATRSSAPTAPTATTWPRAAA